MLLAHTFLQQDHEGDWIDGVRFLYEGKPMPIFDHIPMLYDEILRDSLR
jgi:hypothetical protein